MTVYQGNAMYRKPRPTAPDGMLVDTKKHYKLHWLVRIEDGKVGYIKEARLVHFKPQSVKVVCMECYPKPISQGIVEVANDC